MATPQRRKEPFLTNPDRDDEFLTGPGHAFDPGTERQRAERPRSPRPRDGDLEDQGVKDEPVMTGTHFHSLDEKGRIIVPARLRPALTERFWMMLDENSNVALCNYNTGRDVMVYCERLMRLSPGDEDIAAAVERITQAAEQVRVESDTWRVAIPDVLRYHAQLEKEAVTVGVLNKAILWSRERWQKAQETRLQSSEVRRVQAEILRAAASGLKQPPQVVHKEREDVGSRGTGTDGIARVGPGSARTQAASPGNGGRGHRLPTLSSLGR